MERTCLEQIIRDMGALLGLDGLLVNAKGGLGLQIGEDIRVGIQLHEQQEDLLLYADLGVVPNTQLQAGFLKRLFEASLFGRATGGAAVSLAPDGVNPPRLVLWRMLDWEGLTPSRLEHHLRMLIHAAEDLQEALEEWRYGSSQPECSGEGTCAREMLQFIHQRV